MGKEIGQSCKDRGHSHAWAWRQEAARTQDIVLEAVSTMPGNLGYLLSIGGHGGMLYSYSKKRLTTASKGTVSKSWKIKPPIQAALLRKTKIEPRGVFPTAPPCSWGSPEPAGQRLLCWTWESAFIISLAHRDTGTQQNLAPASTHTHMRERVALTIRFSPVLSV